MGGCDSGARRSVFSRYSRFVVEDADGEPWLRRGRVRDAREEKQALARVEAQLFGEPARPQTVARYILLDRVGSGSGGVVFAAYDPDLDRRVALKLLAPSTATDASDLRRRLLREGKAMAQLSHPNVVRVYDVGTAGQQVFIAAEFIDGSSVESWLAEGRRSWREVVEVFLDAGRGLAAAHDVGLVHRDFKPANVLMGGDGRVLVADFGLARSVNAARAPAVVADPDPSDLARRMTLTGAVLGTPAYMAPEQHAGEVADERADIYSFCAALYEGLYGELPFDTTTLEALVSSKEEGRYRPATARRVPRWCRRILLAGLSPDPQHRPASMHALLRKIERRLVTRRTAIRIGIGAALLIPVFVAGQGNDAADCESEADAALSDVYDQALVERVRGRFLASEATYAAAAWERTEAEMERYAGQWRLARVAVCEATLGGGDEPLEAMTRRMACLDRQAHGFGGVVRVLAQTDAVGIARAAETLHTLPEVAQCSSTATVSGPAEDEVSLAIEEAVARARALRIGAKYGDARETLDEALGGATSKRGVAKINLELGRLCAEEARRDDARGHFETAVAIAEAAGDDDLATEALLSLMALAVAEYALVEAQTLGVLIEAKLSRRGFRDSLHIEHAKIVSTMRTWQRRYDDALEALEGALDLLGEAELADPLREADLLLEKGRVYAHMGRNEEALSHYERLLVIRRARLGESHPKVAGALRQVAMMYQALGRPAQAEEALLRSVALLKAAKVDDDHGGRLYLASIALEFGRLDEALELVETSTQTRSSLRGPDSPDTARAQRLWGAILLAKGDAAQALAKFEKVLAVRRRVYGADHSRTSAPLRGIARALSRLGRHDEARRAARQAVDVSGAEGESPGLTDALRAQAVVSVAADDPEAGRGQSERAFAITERLSGTRSRDYADAALAHAELLESVGDDAAALAAYEQAVTAFGTAAPRHPSLVVSNLGVHRVADRLGRGELAERALAAARSLGDELPIGPALRDQLGR